MNGVRFPELFQHFHLWHFITYGRNAEGLSAVAGVIAAAAATFAGAFAAAAYRETRGQIALLRSQTDATVEQLAIAKGQQDLLVEQHLETLKPHLIFESIESPHKGPTISQTVRATLKNQGTGCAYNILGGTTAEVTVDSLPAGGEAQVHLTFITNNGLGNFKVSCTSLDGREFQCTADVRNFTWIIKSAFQLVPSQPAY